MTLGKLTFEPTGQHADLLATATTQAIKEHSLSEALVAEIDPTLSDTAAFCEAYGIGMEISANCVIVEARRAERTWYAACMVLATDRADVNGIVRRHLDARKTSFAPMDTAVSLTGMEYGGITPIGLPADWPILVDSRVAAAAQVIIGSGVRKSKLLVPGTLLAGLPNAQMIDLVKPAG